MPCALMTVVLLTGFSATAMAWNPLDGESR